MQLFESHAGALDHTLFVKFALPYIRVISKRVRDKLKERNVPCVPMVSLFLYFEMRNIFLRFDFIPMAFAFIKILTD